MIIPLSPDGDDRLDAILREALPRATRYARRCLPHEPQLAEDFAQNAAENLIRRWDQRGEIAPDKPIETAIETAMGHMRKSVRWDITDHWRAQGRRLTSPVAVDDQVLLNYLDQYKDHDHEILALLSRIDAQRLVPTLLALLDERQRQAIVAIHIHGATQKQAAADCGITVRALQERLRKALKALRRHVAATEQVSSTTNHQPREVPR